MPRIRALAIVAVAALAGASPVAAEVTVVPTETVAARLLAAQNAERARVGVKPLVWSAKLADHAKKWAQTLAVSDMFEHAPVGADGGEGENLWFGSKDDYTPEEMIGFFIDEGKQFKQAKFPDVSTTGKWEDVGHYTQLVWKDTREVGCTIASNAQRDFLVCRYWPAGNVIGQPVLPEVTVKVISGPRGGPQPNLPFGVAPVAVPQAAFVADAAPAPSKQVSPSKPTKQASKKRRRGG